MEEKVYVIAIEEVDDCCNYWHKPLVYKSLDEAKKQLKSIWANAKREFDKDKYTFEPKRLLKKHTSFEVYIDGEYSSDHYSVTLSECNVN